jgi:hypothetical protein
MKSMGNWGRLSYRTAKTHPSQHICIGRVAGPEHSRAQSIDCSDMVTHHIALDMHDSRPNPGRANLCRSTAVHVRPPITAQV